MSYYDGEPIRRAGVEIRNPDFPGFLEARGAADVDVSDWYEKAAVDDRIVYFAVTAAADGTPIGEVLLHDIDRGEGRACIHAHLFHEQHRTQGMGEHALKAVVEYALKQQKLKRLELVVKEENFPARRCYAKCGFEQVERVDDDRSQVVMCLTREQWREMVDAEEW
jgi:RimJ/RimL family protein N-acetyltransferase